MNPYRLIRRGPAWRKSLASALADPEGLVGSPSARVFKRNPRSTVALVTVDDASLAVKIFNESRLDRRLLRWFVGSAARRVARSSDRLGTAGFSVPPLVAVLEQPAGLMRSRSCIVTMAVDDGRRADEAWRSLTRTQRMRFARQLAEYARRLHGNGFYPQDLRVDNLLVRSSDERWTFVLVDLDRVRQYRRLTWRRRRKNLVQIDRSLGRYARSTEKLCFLRQYCGAVSHDELRRIVGEIRIASQRKDAEYARRRAKAGQRGGSVPLLPPPPDGA